MIRTGLVVIAALAALAGCINWQESYNSAARDECRKAISSDDRRACLDSVERNASEKRAEQRS
jgi:hypothetical protein